MSAIQETVIPNSGFFSQFRTGLARFLREMSFSDPAIDTRSSRTDISQSSLKAVPEVCNHSGGIMMTAGTSPTNGATVPPQDDTTTTESVPAGTVLFSGNRRPSDDPRAVHPRQRRGVAVELAVVPPEEVEKVMGRHLAQVLRETAAVLEGVQPDGLIRSFVLPGPSHVAKLFSQALAQQLNAPEHRPEVIIGHGTIGGIFAADITQALLDLHCPVVFLPVDRNHRSGAEGYNFLCAEDEIRTILQGKRVLLALPITTGWHSSEVNEIRKLVETEQCAAQVVGIATIIQYGVLTPPLDLKVEALTRVNI